MINNYLSIEELRDNEFDYIIHFNKHFSTNLTFTYNKFILNYDINNYESKFKINYDTKYKYDVYKILLRFNKNIDFEKYIEYLKTLNVKIFISDFNKRIIKKYKNERIDNSNILFIKLINEYNFNDFIDKLISIRKSDYNYKLIGYFGQYINYDINKIINKRIKEKNELEIIYEFIKSIKNE